MLDLFSFLPTLSIRSPGLVSLLLRTIFLAFPPASHDGASAVCSLPPGSPFHNSDLWSKVGRNKPIPLPLLPPSPASLPVHCLPLQLLQSQYHLPFPAGMVSTGNISGAKVLRACTGLAVLTGKLLCVFPLFYPWSLSGPPLHGAG